VNNPKAKAAEIEIAQGLLNVTIMDRGANRLEYYVGDSYTASDIITDPEQCAKKTGAELKNRKNKLVILQADETVSFDKIQELTIKLEREGARIRAKVKHVGARGSTESGGGTTP
jgi:biopolymer transport protein ExbD